MLKRTLFTAVLVGLAALGFAQGAEEALDLEPFFVDIFPPLAAAVGYVVAFFLSKGMNRLPKGVRNVIIPSVAPGLSMAAVWALGQVDSATTLFEAAAWGGFATVIHRIQKGVSEMNKERKDRKESLSHYRGDSR